MTVEIEKLCNVLDKLTVDSLTLMEEQVQLKLNIENAMCDGETHLAKARYILGHNNVSALQLPTENTPEFSASLKVNHESTDDSNYNQRALQRVTKSEDEAVHDPLKWFGVLVPQNLSYAQNMFRQALQWVIKSADVQDRLNSTCENIDALKAKKLSLQSD